MPDLVGLFACSRKTRVGVVGRIVVIVAPHERREAIEAYRDRLTPNEIEAMLEAPSEEWIKLNLGPYRPRTYDDWKTTNPNDEELGPRPERDPDEAYEQKRDDDAESK